MSAWLERHPRLRNLWWLLTTPWLFRYEVNKRAESLMKAVVWRLPNWVIYWATIRAGTQTIANDEVVPEVLYTDVLTRLDDPALLKPRS